MLLAKMENARPIRLGQFRNVERRWFFAMLTLHLGFSRVLVRGKLVHW